MRSDMKKVIVSRPRVGGEGKIKRSKRGGKEPMRPRGYERKQQTDLLGPLYRFIRSRVGKNWDSVWSEICEHADSRSMMGDHLRRHVSYIVEQPSLGNDGNLYDSYGRIFDTTSSFFRHQEFYVDPRTKILCVTSQRRKYRPEETETKVFECDGLYYHNHEGLWFRVKMEEIPARQWESRWCPNISDEFLSNTHPAAFDAWSWLLRDNLKGKYGLSPNGLYWYCTEKRSANSKEIRKLHAKIQNENA